MGKMTITAYTDGSFNSECKSALDLPINPDKVKLGKGITYAEDRQLGSLNGSNVYVRYKPETFCFECLLDQVVFYIVFKLMGQFTDAEVRSARGRADAVVKTPKYIYVFEFKLHDTAEAALKQIDDKGYLIPYQADGREVIKIGVEFSAEKRNISRWLV